jgi:hypothetical protein
MVDLFQPILHTEYVFHHLYIMLSQFSIIIQYTLQKN